MSTSTHYTLSLHDALPISHDVDSTLAHGGTSYATRDTSGAAGAPVVMFAPGRTHHAGTVLRPHRAADRKSTRLNSSHTVISYAVFCLKKKIRLTGVASSMS